MTVRELLMVWLGFGRDLDKEVRIRIVTRDEEGFVTGFKSVKVERWHGGDSLLVEERAVSDAPYEKA